MFPITPLSGSFHIAAQDAQEEKKVLETAARTRDYAGRCLLCLACPCILPCSILCRWANKKYKWGWFNLDLPKTHCETFLSHIRVCNIPCCCLDQFPHDHTRKHFFLNAPERQRMDHIEWAINQTGHARTSSSLALARITTHDVLS